MSHTNSVLNALSELKPTGVFPQRLLMRDPSLASTVEMQVHQLDSLSMQLSMLRVSPERTNKMPLKEKAGALAQRITGLMENLSVIEVDDAQGIALLRSDTPATQDDHRLYYELMLTRLGMTTLHRYQGSMQHAHRKEMPFTLTREVLAKLICDLVS